MSGFRALVGVAVGAAAGYALGRRDDEFFKVQTDRVREFWHRDTGAFDPPRRPPDGTEFDHARERESAERHRVAERLKEFPLSESKPPDSEVAPNETSLPPRVGKRKDPREDLPPPTFR